MFIANNEAAWVELELAIIDTSALAFANKTRDNFRKPWLTILSMWEGKDHMNKHAIIANNIIGTNRTKGGLIYQYEYTYIMLQLTVLLWHIGAHANRHFVARFLADETNCIRNSDVWC